MPNIQIEIHDDGIVAAFNRLIALGEDPEPVLDAIGRQLKANIQLGFAQSRDPYGTPWAPLKTRQGQPLVKDGHLRNSIDYQVDDNSVVVGTNKVQAKLQNFGGTVKAKDAGSPFFMVGDRKVFVKSVTIPARPFMPSETLPADWREDILDILRAATENAVKD